jgi:hypothetical protein
MVSRKLFVEGGGDHRDLEDECRRGFSKFLEKAGCTKKMPRIIACGGRAQAVDRYTTAMQEKKATDKVALLVDSECPVAAAYSGKPWGHLSEGSAGGFSKPSGARDKDAHLMVECMEAWFLADLAGLQKGLGKAYTKISVPHAGRIELISKTDVMSLMESAASGRYSKGGQSFKILAQIEPTKVAEASLWAKRFIDEMKK